MDGGTQQQGQRHQAKGDGGDQCRWSVAVFRGLHGRLGDRVLAASAHEALWTLAHGAGEVDVALAAVVAGEQVAGAGAHRAVLAGEAERARACEVVDAVDAGAGVAAGGPGTVVDVSLTVRAGEARPTAAHGAFTEVQTLSACRENDTERCQSLTHSRTERRMTRRKHHTKVQALPLIYNLSASRQFHQINEETDQMEFFTHIKLKILKLIALNCDWILMPSGPSHRQKKETRWLKARFCCHGTESVVRP